MDNRRRSFLAAAGSVVTGVLAGCPGMLGPGNNRSGTNGTGTDIDGAGVELPTEISTAYPSTSTTRATPAPCRT